jgi:hypothetical protein
MLTTTLTPNGSILTDKAVLTWTIPPSFAVLKKAKEDAWANAKAKQKGMPIVGGINVQLMDFVYNYSTDIYYKLNSAASFTKIDVGGSFTYSLPLNVGDKVEWYITMKLVEQKYIIQTKRTDPAYGVLVTQDTSSHATVTRLSVSPPQIKIEKIPLPSNPGISVISVTVAPKTPAITPIKNISMATKASIDAVNVSAKTQTPIVPPTKSVQTTAAPKVSPVIDQQQNIQQAGVQSPYIKWLLISIVIWFVWKKVLKK